MIPTRKFPFFATKLSPEQVPKMDGMKMWNLYSGWALISEPGGREGSPTHRHTVKYVCIFTFTFYSYPVANIRGGRRMVLLHNGGSCIACTIKRSITLLCIMVLFLNCWLYKIVLSTTLGNMPCKVLSQYYIVKKYFFPDRTEWCSFNKIPDF
jgi:hypothetical protein